MLQWVSKLLSGVSVDLPPGVPAAWAGKLEKVLAPLDTVQRRTGSGGLGRDVLQYVLHGEPSSALAELAQNNAAREKLSEYNHGREQVQAALYKEFESLPGDVMLRWAMVLDTLLSGRTQSLVFASGIHWPEALLAHATGRGLGYYSGDQKVPEGLTMRAFERALEAAGQPASSFITASFASPIGAGRWNKGLLEFCPKVPGIGDAITRHAEAIRPLLLPPAVAQRLHVLELLDRTSSQTLEAFANELADLATSSSKQVRMAAEPLLRKIFPSMTGPLRALARDGKPDQRVCALRLLWDIARATTNEALRAEAREIAAADKAPTAQALIAEWDGTAGGAAGETAGEQHVPAQTRYDYEVPVVSWADALTPMVERALAGLCNDIARAVELTNKEGREWEAKSRTTAHPYKWTDVPYLHPVDQKRLYDYIASPNPKLAGKPVELRLGWRHQVAPLLERFALADGVGPVPVVKVLAFFGQAGDQLDLHRSALAAVINAMFRAKQSPTLLELQVMLAPIGIGPKALFIAYCWGWGSPLARDWPDEAVWPFFAAHLDVLIEHLNPAGNRDYGFDREAVFKAISTLPTPPASVIHALYDLALGTQKTERPRAQLALSNLPNKEARIISALADGKSEVRAIAADWLRRLRHAPAIPALEAALQKEKNDVAKGALLDALEALGQSVDKYLDRAALAADARKTVAKEAPKDLAWMPWDTLPRVRWGDTGDEVGREVLQGLVVQAYKQKSPEPNAVLRKYCRMFEPNDREAFGQFVLEAWLREDVRPIPPDEALQRARSQAQATHGWMQRAPQYYKDDPNFGKTVEELTAAYLPAMQRVPAGSAAGAKGVLAIASACCAERAAPAVARFLKEYYGTRASQGKSLIAMLAWIEHPSATQLMLSIGNRFRTKSFQEEATRQAEALADRKGWTLSELADRTIPSAGFDESNELELSYGDRKFTAKLLPDFKIELYNPEGKKISALPEPRQDDDAEQAKNAKKALSAAKKEIKSIVDLQSDRLYESLCTARDWSFEDWQLYLNRHPVMHRLIQGLVWVEGDGAGGVKGTFRPLDDGTLTDVEDNEVTIEPQARVRIAHDSFLPAGVSAAWQKHLADYEVAPLFQQFGKGQYRLPEDKQELADVSDFRGHLIEAFALRGRALKLGYTRGAAEDGGVFVTYEKRFPTLGITAMIEFTGNGLPEENRTVALLELYFSRAAGNSWQRDKMKLSQVPRVLLSECYDDMRSIAAEGTGYDTEWERKSAW